MGRADKRGRCGRCRGRTRAEEPRTGSPRWRNCLITVRETFLVAVSTTVAHWLNPAAVRALSTSLSDPPSIAKERGIAAERVGELPMEPNPLYRQYGYFTGVDLTGLDPSAPGSAVARPRRRP